MLRVLLLTLATLPSLTVAVRAAETVTSANESVPEADRVVTSFLDLLRAGKGSDAVRSVIGGSPLWAKRSGAQEAMIGQIDAAVQAYGPVQSYERISSERKGTMLIRQYYFVQHRDMITRWEFDLVRTASGWSVAYFGFADQPNAWF